MRFVHTSSGINIEYEDEDKPVEIRFVQAAISQVKETLVMCGIVPLLIGG